MPCNPWNITVQLLEGDLGWRRNRRLQVWLRDLEGDRAVHTALVSNVLQVVKPPYNASVPAKLGWREIRLQMKVVHLSFTLYEMASSSSLPLMRN